MSTVDVYKFVGKRMQKRTDSTYCARIYQIFKIGLFIIFSKKFLSRF